MAGVRFVQEEWASFVAHLGGLGDCFAEYLDLEERSVMGPEMMSVWAERELYFDVAMGSVQCD